ncbi:MAG: cupin domain-containing protein [Planctomycetes bacterium]|nr:cupin domain-containing protein [Planctomycetota bacterium]
MRTPLIVLVSAAAGAIAAAALAPLASSAAPPPADAGSRFRSKVVRWEEAAATEHPWGEFRRYFTGEGAGVKDVFTAVAVVKPGEAVHKAHKHAEEEFLAILAGEGVWHLDGKELPLKKGDILYVEPWVMHGCTNTGSEPLKFLVVKLSGKGVPVPADPAAQAK